MLILYIGFAQPDEWASWGSTYARHAQRFEQASGDGVCMVLPFWKLTRPWMQRIAPDAVVLSGFARSFEQYDPASLVEVGAWIEQTTAPTLALCGSHQLLGFLFNGRIDGSTQLCDEPMRPRRADEPVLNPDYHPDFFMERGFYPLELTALGRSDPLFADLGEPPYLYESHYCEIKQTLPQFDLLASTSECRIQAIRHQNRPLYGLQFHPEDYSERFPDGKRLLENFFSLR